jgi:hypothetical protein
VEKGKEKRYIACNTPRPGEEDFHTVMERLKEEAETGLHIGHVDAAYHTRDGNEGNSRKGGSDHSERNNIPGRTAVAAEELEVVITHDRLMDFLTSREDSATEKGGQPVLKSY